MVFDFNKVYVKYVFIIIKIKYINSDKINFTIKLYIFYNQNTKNIYKNNYKYYNL